MAEIKKTSTRKKASAKAPAATTVSTPSPVYKPAAPVAPAPVKATSAGRTISTEERARMVQEAAYYRAEKRGFQGDPHADWVAAEKEISAKLSRENVRVA